MSEGGNRTTLKAQPLRAPRASARYVLVFEPDRTRAVDLPDRGTIVVGRAPDVDVVLDDPSVSRRQVELRVEGRKVVARDLGSSNGTLVDDETLFGEVEIETGSVLRMGSSRLVLGDAAEGSRRSGLLAHSEFEAHLGARLETAKKQESLVALFLVRSRSGEPGLVASAIQDVLGAGAQVGAYGLDHYEAIAAAGSGATGAALASGLGAALKARGVDAVVGCAVFPRESTSRGELLALCMRALKSQAGQEGGADGPVVVDQAMQAALDLARRVASGRIPVLILGETGSGKEIVASAIHRWSPRASGPFVRLNCAALPESLLEAELFGYEKGTFTGAGQAKPGLFEAADGGTLLLDEVGELPLSQQAKLLRALEDGGVRRLGSLRDRHVDVRLLAATNVDLERSCARGTFRSDLYYRLSGATVTVPALRDRPADILALARHFLDLAGLRRRGLSVEAEEALLRYPWPGNVRELRNAIERAALLCGQDPVRAEHLPDRVRLGVGCLAISAVQSSTGQPAPALAEKIDRPTVTPVEAAAPDGPAAAPRSSPAAEPGAASAGAPGESAESGPAGPTARGYVVRQEMRRIERARLVEALDACNGNRTHTAARLGISRRALVTKLAAMGLADWGKQPKK